MKIAHLPSSFFPTVGGAEISVYNIADEQCKANHEVTLILYPRSYRYFKKNKINCAFKILGFYPFTRFFYNIISNLRLNANFIIEFQIKRLQRKNNYQVWHFSLLDSLSLIAINTLKSFNVKIIASFRGSDIQKIDQINYGQRLEKKYENALFKALPNIDEYTAISESVIEEYHKLNIKKNKITLIPNGIDLKRFNSFKKDVEVFKNIFSYDKQKIILTVGRNHPKKGYKNIEQIINSLKQIRKDFIWLLVGEGTDEIVNNIIDSENLNYLKSYSLNQTQKATTIYPQDELIKIYKSCDVFVFPTLIETLGNVQIEAMAAKVPVVSSNVPGCKNIIDNNNNGFLCNPFDYKDFAITIDKILSNPKLIKLITENALNKITDLDMNNISKKYIDVYRKK